jgi:hypothetical protein
MGGARRSIYGLILVKELVLVDPEENLTAGQLVSRPLPRLRADTPLYQLLRLFEAGGSHMVCLTKPPNWRGGDNPEGLAPSLSGVSSADSQTLTRIKSGIIKAGDNMLYIEAEQRSPKGGSPAPADFVDSDDPGG